MEQTIKNPMRDFFIFCLHFYPTEMTAIRQVTRNQTIVLFGMRQAMRYNKADDSAHRPVFKLPSPWARMGSEHAEAAFDS